MPLPTIVELTAFLAVGCADLSSDNHVDATGPIAIAEAVGIALGGLPPLADLERSVNRLVAADLLDATTPSALTLSPKGEMVLESMRRLKSKRQIKKLAEAMDSTSDSAHGVPWTLPEQGWQHARRQVLADLLRRQHDRRHIIGGLLTAHGHWDDVCDAVALAEDRGRALDALQAAPLGLSEIQAEHVLDMTIGQRTVAARRNLEHELGRLDQEIAELDVQR